MDCDEGMSSLEKFLHNLSLDIAPDDETYIASPLAKKARCSTPLTKVQESSNVKLDNQNIILDEMRMLLPTVLNEMKKNDHLETWLSLNRMIHNGSFPLYRMYI